YGRACGWGSEWQAPMPASASDAPISFSRLRRSASLSPSNAAGNSAAARRARRPRASALAMTVLMLIASPVADAAVGQLGRLDMEALHRRRAVGPVRRAFVPVAPVHAGDLIRRPQVRGRIAVAVEAEPHLQRVAAVGQR